MRAEFWESIQPRAAVRLVGWAEGNSYIEKEIAKVGAVPHCVQWLKWNLGSIEQGYILSCYKNGIYLYIYSTSSNIFEKTYEKYNVCELSLKEQKMYRV
jgi:hypothetical protein